LLALREAQVKDQWLVHYLNNKHLLHSSPAWIDHRSHLVATAPHSNLAAIGHPDLLAVVRVRGPEAISADVALAHVVRVVHPDNLVVHRDKAAARPLSLKAERLHQ
jgi:predicted short-subunit dehydrogenase-like oxidoreductase (DUF2520 family)